MPSQYFTQCRINMLSGIVADAAINTWSVRTATTGDLVALTDWHGYLGQFYLDVGSMMSVRCAGTITMQSYDRAASPPRQPVLTTAHTFVKGASQFPSEVALCLSFQGERVSGFSQARRRGRIYLGPLTNVGMTTEGLVPVAITDQLRDAGQGLINGSVNKAGWDWEVWSETNQIGVPVTDGWVDNAFDTQRRRGLKPSLRDTFT